MLEVLGIVLYIGVLINGGIAFYFTIDGLADKYGPKSVCGHLSLFDKSIGILAEGAFMLLAGFVVLPVELLGKPGYSTGHWPSPFRNRSTRIVYIDKYNNYCYNIHNNHTYQYGRSLKISSLHDERKVRLGVGLNIRF
jgi:hypothetical protein